MISNFFINLLLLISATFIAGHLSKDKPFSHEAPIGNKVILGIGGGILGTGLMIYTIMVKGTITIIDLRVMPVMMTFYIGGFIPSVITSAIIILFRILYYGLSYSAVVGIIQIVAVIPVYILINSLRLNSKRKWTTMVLATMVILISTVYYLLYNIKDVFIVLSMYSIFYIIAFIIIYILWQYVQSANELYRRYKGEATKDFLTGLNNSRQFDLEFSYNIENAKEKHQNLSCLMIDIDHFKEVNDTYGHASGDQVLMGLARILKKACRKTDIISRVGGEEFCILLMDCSFTQAQKVAYEICNLVGHSKFNIGTRNIYITVSIGVSTFPETISTADDLLEQADKALYRAKQTGRNKVCCVSNL